MRQMSATQVSQWVKSMESQGVTVTRTKKGLLLRLPNGATAMKHFTVSDIRGTKNLAAELRRAGIMSPDDNKIPDLPDYITKGTVSDTTKKRVHDYIRANGYPSEVYSSAVSDACFPKDPAQANRALYHAGCVPGKAMSKRRGRPWHTPQWLLDEKKPEPQEEVVDTRPEVKIEHATFEAPSEPTPLVESVKDRGGLDEAIPTGVVTPEPEPVAEKNSVEEPPAADLEFIDDRDSWAVDLEEVLGLHLARMVNDRLSVIKAVGLEYEMRVWKKQ